jgi:23S rRNA (uracil1939-C5)-methyltransferase
LPAPTATANSCSVRGVAERLIVTRIGHLGDGIADTPRGLIYVPYALPGETVEVQLDPKHPDRAHLIEIETPSPERVEPVCPHFGVCGGCAMQHWRMDRYRAWKRDLVVTALAQAGLDTPVDDLIDAHGAGRRRAVLHARRGTRDVFAVGFSARRAHRVVAIDRCPIFAPAMHGTIEAAWSIAEALDPARKPLDIHVTAANEGLDIDVRGSGPLRPDQVAALARIAAERMLARITRHGELVAQPFVPTITMGRARVPLPPGAFLQPTEAGEAALAGLVLENTRGARSIIDLFCGIGPFTLRLAERARVSAVDSAEPAIAALTRAAATTPGLKPVDTQVRDLFRRPFVAGELASYDAVVFDPPRQGAQAQAKEIAASKVAIVAAVSCNPGTFARDARILVDGGYRFVRVTPVDQFRYSPHVEVVALLER